MTTLIEAIDYAKKDVSEGYALDYYVHNGCLFLVTTQGEVQVFPGPEDDLYSNL